MGNYEKMYKEALERAKYLKENTDSVGAKDISYNFEYIFPELRESEDEKIRKALLEHFGTYHSGSAITNDVVVEDVLAWLEKQGEQNTIVNESPSKEMILAVWELGNIWKELTKGSSCTEYGTQLQYIQKHWNESVYYEKLQGKQKPIEKVEPKFKVGDVIRNKWSNRTKTIISIDDYQYTVDDGMPAQPFKVNINVQDNWELVEQKPAWNEEDERNLKGIVTEIEANKNDAPDYDLATYDRFLSWLKSLKDRVQSHQKQGWSEEDNERLLRIHQFIWANRRGDTDEIYQQERDADWLKSLKPNHWKPSKEQMEALNAINNIGELSYVEQSDLLVKLYNDLKKL